MLRLLFVLIILAIGGIAAIRSRFSALLLYVWFALFRPQEWVWIDISAFRLSTVLGAILVIPCLLSGVWPVIGHPLSVGALAFLASCLGGQLNAINQAVGWYWLDFMAKLILVMMLAIRLNSSAERLFTFITVMAVSFGFQAAKAGFSSLFAGGERYFIGTGGAFVDNNAYAVGCVMTLPFLIVMAQNARRSWVRWVGVAAAIGTMAMVIATFSRGGLLALSACFVVLVILQRRRWLFMSITFIAASLVFMVALPTGYFDRMATIGTYDEVNDNSALGRLYFWKVALDMSADYPTGIGLWNFADMYDRYDTSDGFYGSRRAVHSSHLQVLTETGWAGGAIWVSLFAIAIRICMRVRRRSAEHLGWEGDLYLSIANASLASMAGFLVGGSFVSMALNDLTWLTFGVIASLDRISRNIGTASAVPAVHAVV